jgi:endonuclease/exonuclease/phosphatase family metal-dependent hydrolase
MSKLSVLSLNLNITPLIGKIYARLNFFCNQVQKLNPDIILLQELFGKKPKKFVIRNLKKSGYLYHPEKLNNWRKGGLFYLSKFKIQNHTYTPFLEQGPILPLSLFDRLIKKGLQTVKFTIGDKLVYILNTHLIAQHYHTKWEQKANYRQVEELIEHTKQIKKQNPHLIIVCGDFNLEPKSENYQLLTKNNFYDPLHGSKEYTYSTDNVNIQRLIKTIIPIQSRRMDLMLFKGLKPADIEQKIVFKNKEMFKNKEIQISDHYGLLSKIKL